MAVVAMSREELGRLEALIDLDAGRTTAARAAALLGIGERQVFRPLRAYRTRGAEGLASRRRGRPSNRRYADAIREAALDAIRGRYRDFGPTLAAEKPAQVHDLRLGRETVRRWMAAAGLWVPREDRGPRVHQPRHRRGCLGELVQVDGCEHRRFEDRGPPCTLLVLVDDATGRLTHLGFVAGESTLDYLRAAGIYVGAHGRPVAFHSDKRTVFRVAGAGRDGGVTQFGRALRELNIDINCASGPQAKGRVGSRWRASRPPPLAVSRRSAISRAPRAVRYRGPRRAERDRRRARARPRASPDGAAREGRRSCRSPRTAPPCRRQEHLSNVRVRGECSPRRRQAAPRPPPRSVARRWRGGVDGYHGAAAIHPKGNARARSPWAAGGPRHPAEK